MKIYLKFIKAIIDIGMFFIGMGVYVFYITEFTLANMKEFLTTSGIVFGGLIGITSLVLGYNALRGDDTENKNWRTNTSTKFMLGTIYFLLASISGIFIIELQEKQKLLWMLWPLRSIGFLFICLSWNYINLALIWLMDYLWVTEFGEEALKWWSVRRRKKESKNISLPSGSDSQDLALRDNQKISEKVTEKFAEENPTV